MAKCVAQIKACQGTEARLDYGFNWTDVLARKWTANHPYDVGITIRPAGDPTGFQYESSGGQSAATEPSWPTEEGGTVVDGSITWTAAIIDDTSLEDQIDSDAWSTSDPSGLTVEPASPVVSAGLQQTSVVLSEGTSGRTYTVENEMTTTGGFEYIGRVVLTIS